MLFRDRLVKVVAVAVVLLGVLAQAAEPLPFPDNRIRDFYRGQARAALDAENVGGELLPEFPGLMYIPRTLHDHARNDRRQKAKAKEVNEKKGGIGLFRLCHNAENYTIIT
jgi:hypothetical protein